MLKGEYWKIGEELWVVITKRNGDEAHFEVLNGAWTGRLDIERNRVYVKETRKYFFVDSTDGPLTRQQVKEACGY